MTLRCLPLLLLLPFGQLMAAGGGRGNPGTTGSPNPSENLINKPLSAQELKATPKSVFQRVVQARVYNLGFWTLEDASQTPVTAGRTISSLRPSFVTGLLRLADRGVPGNAESEAFATIRSAVRSAVKGCRFDVEIDAGNETSGSLLVRRMKEVDSRIHPDAWTLFVPPDSTSINPEALADAISLAHSLGEMAGYDGPLSLIPEGVDYIVIRAWSLQVSREQLERLSSRRVPLIVELPNNFGSRDHPDCTRYLREMDGVEKASLLSRLAMNQGAWGYRFAYPVFYPLQSPRKAFDSTKDSILMVTMRSLMTRFN